MRLPLKKANASIELTRYRNILVISKEGSDESRVVGPNLSDVWIFASAESGIAIACSLTLYRS